MIVPGSSGCISQKRKRLRHECLEIHHHGPGRGRVHVHLLLELGLGLPRAGMDPEHPAGVRDALDIHVAGVQDPGQRFREKSRQDPIPL